MRSRGSRCGGSDKPVEHPSRLTNRRPTPARRPPARDREWWPAGSGRVSEKVAEKSGASSLRRRTLRRRNRCVVEDLTRVALNRLSTLGRHRLAFPVLTHPLPPAAGIDGLLGLDFLRGSVRKPDFLIGQWTSCAGRCGNRTSSSASLPWLDWLGGPRIGCHEWSATSALRPGLGALVADHSWHPDMPTHQCHPPRLGPRSPEFRVALIVEHGDHC